MKKYYFLFAEGSKVNQIICAVLINLPVFAYGACIGWMSPMTLLLQSDNSPRDTPLTDNEVSWMAAIPYFFCPFLDFILAIMADKVGRKITLIVISISVLGVWIFKLISMSIWAFLLARICVSVSMAGCYVICPVYIKEISEDSIRGILGSTVILSHTTGNLFLYIIGDIMDYNAILWLCLAIPAIHLALFVMMPESPSYLVKCGKLDEAAKALGWLRCRQPSDTVLLDELDRIKKEQEIDDESGGFVFKSILTDKILFRALKIALVVSIAREVCGAIPVLNFAGEIFSMASNGKGLILTPNQQAMMLGAVQVAGSALASSVVEKAGRKPLLFITSLISGLSMCTLASWFLARSFDVHAPGWLPVVTLCLCIFCDSSGLAPMSVVITGEMFSFKYRGTVMAITMATASSCDFIQMLVFKPLANSIGIHASFYFFGIICILAAIYVIMVVPETKMRSVSEIQRDLKTKKELKEEMEMIQGNEKPVAV